jgi:hypothetical protein
VLDHPSWDQVKLLDFGGNWGNFLRDPSCILPSKNYWCLDVDEQALRLGKRDFPDAHWIGYGKMNYRYNPTGSTTTAVPQLSTVFDLIIAYSVFTHTTISEMAHTVRESLIPLLSARGRCVITFLAPDRLPYFLKRYGNLDDQHILPLLEKAKTLQGRFYLYGKQEIIAIDNDLTIPTVRNKFISFYEPVYIQTLWPELVVSMRCADAEQQIALILERYS